MTHANRNYKNSLFTSYFSDKARLIEAYNAIAGTDYPVTANIEFNTLENVLWGSQLNDISFTIEGRYIVLIEHQSTISENMPLRLLQYYSRVLERTTDRKTLYRKALCRIPTPEFFVLYNGREPYPDRDVLRLSDAFMEKAAEIQLELVVPVYNISEGHNAEILKRSRALSDYAAFVAVVNGFQAQGDTHEEAIRKTIRKCRESGIMEAYLEVHGSEVENMLLTEFNVEEYYEVGVEEGIAKGIAKGEARGREEGVAQGRNEEKKATACKMKAAGLDTPLIAKCLDITEKELDRILGV